MMPTGMLILLMVAPVNPRDLIVHFVWKLMLVLANVTGEVLLHPVLRHVRPENFYLPKIHTLHMRRLAVRRDISQVYAVRKLKFPAKIL